VEVPISSRERSHRHFSGRAFGRDLNQLRMGLVQQVVKFRSRAVIVM